MLLTPRDIIDNFLVVNRLQKLPIILSFLAGILLTSAVSFVYAHGGDLNLIHACVRTNNGSLRIIGANDDCNANETNLDWNIQGPPGPTGSPGPVGPPGAGNGLPLICTECLFNNLTVGNTLVGKDLTAAAIANSSFGDVNLTNTNLTNSILSNSMFEDTILTNTNFSNSQMKLVTMHSITLTDVDFTNADLSDSHLGHAQSHSPTIFSNTNFTNTNLTNVVFDNINLSGSLNMSTATRTNISWTNTTCPDGTNSDNNGNTCEDHLTP